MLKLILWAVGLYIVFKTVQNFFSGSGGSAGLPVQDSSHLPSPDYNAPTLDNHVANVQQSQLALPAGVGEVILRRADGTTTRAVVRNAAEAANIVASAKASGVPVVYQGPLGSYTGSGTMPYDGGPQVTFFNPMIPPPPGPA